jgi:putative DNA primase/helicase
MADEFKAVAAAALAKVEALLPQLIGGRLEGREWRGARTAAGGPGDSWSINIDTGLWRHYASGKGGGDVISMYAALHGIDQLPAMKAVADLIGYTADTPYVPILPRAKPPEEPPEPIPFDTPPVPPHKDHGPATAVYRYGDAFIVARYDYPGGKDFRQLTWREGRWTFKGYPAPRELYNKAELEKHADAPVILVEGEKCVEAARAVLKKYVLVTWAGGAGAVKKNDWSPLKGRDVIIWPDADEPGREAAAAIAQLLLPIAAKVRVINVPEDTEQGWDISDAIADGWDVKRISEWATKYLKPIMAPAGVQKSPVRDTPPKSTVEDNPDDSALVNWQSLGLDCNQGGLPHPTVSNASLILQMHPRLKGRIWLDTFRNRIYHTLRGPVPIPWTDADTLRMTVMVQQQLRLPKITSRLMHEAVAHAAGVAARNSLTEWLDSLVWDETPRLDTWLADCLGCDLDEYTMAISRNWPIGMVARAYVPGCKMDNMPVLEGVSGLSKTTFLEVLGDPWYKSLSIAFGDKDFLQAIQGAWLVEIPDMTGFSRREQSHILATITTRTDSYRASYGHTVEDHPRTTVFAATSETDDYLQDSRGRRRYWPIRCEEIDIAALRAQKDQVFAEAVQRYRAGEAWYVVPNQAAEEQQQRAEKDIWTERVLDYCEHAKDSRGRVTMDRILFTAIEMPIAKQGISEQRRVARILREAGWIRGRTSDSRYWTKKGTPP